MEENVKINVGLVLSCTIATWREIEKYVCERAILIYARKAPLTTRLVVREEPWEKNVEEGENENGREFRF